jgi:hypothetical protein
MFRTATLAAAAALALTLGTASGAAPKTLHLAAVITKRPVEAPQRAGTVVLMSGRRRVGEIKPYFCAGQGFSSTCSGRMSLKGFSAAVVHDMRVTSECRLRRRGGESCGASSGDVFGANGKPTGTIRFGRPARRGGRFAVVIEIAAA